MADEIKLMLDTSMLSNTMEELRGMLSELRADFAQMNSSVESITFWLDDYNKESRKLRGEIRKMIREAANK